MPRKTTMNRPSLVKAAMVVAAATIVVGCGGAPKAANTPEPLSETAVTSAEPTQPTGSNLHVSDEIAEKCKLRFNNVSEAPKYGTDEDGLSANDRDVLQQVATCMTTGPLKGRNVQLVGRADPRGATEYNMALGARRSDGVDKYLVGLGVEASRLKSTSRGELDATGNDETSWQKDRRVDILLAD